MTHRDQPPIPVDAQGDSLFPGRYWSTLNDGRIQCDLCPRYCRIKPGQRGFCYVRKNVDGAMVLTTYGRSSGFCADPIEKKPLNHFYPGTSILSFGTAGCNLGCKFCQNWDISKSRSMDKLASRATPRGIAEAALDAGCESVAFTYNDPVIFAEYAIDTAQACREAGVKTVVVSAGYITEAARTDFYRYIDAANIDLKAFSQQFYKKICFGALEPVLETLKYLKHETDVWFEITTLLIPGENDSDEELHKLSEWVVENLGLDVPLHFTAFHPDFRMLDKSRTPAETLLRARDIALSKGIHYAYVGNVHNWRAGSTYCPGCGEVVIERDWYQLGVYRIGDGGTCGLCGHAIAGCFRTSKGNWQGQRQRVLM
ncbi:AmmeMemoRadiSam system radical SAM enzyme [Sulfidibacter corallicola]|uniref:AmmeMemoRadiSam system radical SAM enzyme n=1 Tax=Sulfidibacter corallicola TaxID=2818388 RepID=A0A8A4TIS4_SULCO|nr:AmmeMemoRadiSam system radical SAM enzyme [Sulfidibacter corallicola]QTD48698.1 AmmeMemoRadiSam system radical SAM enzyme [Sulfidibacter corallicola]